MNQFVENIENTRHVEQFQMQKWRHVGLKKYQFFCDVKTDQDLVL